MTLLMPRLNAFPGSAILERITAALPVLYLAWALPLVLAVAVVTPPWQNPDEATHMLRISQIAHGGLLGYRFGHDAGGVADPAILRSLLTVYSVFQHYHHKVSLGMLGNAGSVQWGVPTQVGFAATARYPPILYAPAVLAVEAGNLLRLSVVHSLIAARMANALAAALVAALALSLARRTRLALAALLVLPMTVALFASAAQDGLMIALTLAVVACVDRVLAEERDPAFWEAMLIGVGTVIVITARPTNLPMAALPLVCARQLHRRAWLSAAAIAAVAMIWTAYMLSCVSVPLFPSVNPAAQLTYLLHRPWVILPIATNTLLQFHSGYLAAFIGVLGSLDTPLPASYYNYASFVLLLAFASVAVGPSRRTWLSLLIFLAAAGAVFFASYLTWTLPKADHVDGIEGRYFLPLAAVLALAMPNWRRLGAMLWPAALVALLAFALITPMVIIHALVLRYYLVP
ncbi:MAG TPA: DUF2142 domain-containing protein [Acetobacteraceae bacterium]|nr:DUF2142 domain-containing protein [Acetobacteraceae bacterium]